jgi:hypothetical protein
MKKGVLAVFIFSFVLSLSLVSSFNLELSKSEYFPGETLQLEIPDIFIDNLQEANMGIYKIDGIHKMPAESSIIKSRDKYYYYAVLPELTGDYILKIENALHYENNIQTSETISKEFSIVSSNSSYLSFNPGFIFASSDFSIIIKSYNSIQKVSIQFPEAKFNQSFNLNPGAEKKVYISTSAINEFLISSIKINSYSIPAIISPVNVNTTKPIPANTSLKELIEIIPVEINATILEKTNYEFKIAILNKADQQLNNFIIRSSSKSIIVENLTSIPLGKKEINLTINTDKNFIGYINLTFQNSSIIVPVNILTTKNISNTSSNIPPVNIQKTCAEKKGLICNLSLNEECTGVQEESLTGICCLAECKQKSSSSKWLWGLILIIFLAIGGWLIYKKAQQKPGHDKASEILNKRAEDYKERISNPVEVKKSLSKD